MNTITVGILMVLLVLMVLPHITYALYIKGNGNDREISNLLNDDWSSFQHKLGLTRQKVDLLKSQKDQQGTKELLKRFINDNAKHVIKPTEEKQSNELLKIYQRLIKNLKMSKSSLKTSLNFELADKPKKNLKRERRKIAVKMVSNIPPEGIEGFLRLLYQKQRNYNAEFNTNSDDLDYSESDMPLPSATDSDYAYENLYDDEEDLALSAKSNHNSEYDSFQDLILQAKRNQWKHENEEKQLHNPPNEHFI